MKKILQTLFYLFFPLFMGVIVAFFIRNHIDYSTLVKPAFAPPSILFPIVWVILYLLMGLSYSLYKKDFEKNEFLDGIYYFQLFVNLLWSILFFLWKARFFAILWILLLDVLVLYLLYLFWNKKKISALLNLPYLLWILFATYLTISIAVLNFKS